MKINKILHNILIILALVIIVLPITYGVYRYIYKYTRSKEQSLRKR